MYHWEINFFWQLVELNVSVFEDVLIPINILFSGY